MGLETSLLSSLLGEQAPAGTTAGVDWPGLARRSQYLARARELDELLSQAVDTVTDVCGAEAASVWLYDSARERLELVSESGLTAAQEAAAGGRPRWRDLFKLPLNAGGSLHGVLEAYTNHADGFSAEQRAAVTTVGATLASGVQARRLEERIRGSEGHGDAYQQLQTLWRMYRRTSHAATHEGLFEALLGCLAEAVAYDAAVLLVAGGAQPVCLAGLRAAGHEQHLPLVRDRAILAFRDAGGVLAPDAVVPIRLLAQNESVGRDVPLTDGFGVTLLEAGEPVGLLYLAAAEAGTFTTSQKQVLNQYAEYAGESLARISRLLRAELSRLETIIESLPQGVVMLDPAGKILMANRSGASQLELLAPAGEPVTEIGPWQVAELVEEATASGIDLTRRETEMRLGDRSYHFALTMVPVRDEGGLVGSVISIEDITGIRQTEQRLFHDARLASIGEFASGLAHELNNPMMIILGLAELLHDDDSTPEGQRPLLANIEQAAKRAAEIVKQLTVFADTQRLQGWDTLDLPEVLGQAMGLVATQCEVDNVAITTEIDPATPQVTGNAGALQDLVLELMRNAHEAIVQSGSGSRIWLRVKPQGQRVVVEVEDDGPGVAADLRDRIFDVFFTTKRDYRGKGLGLSVAHRIAIQHKGELSLEDGTHGGARFRFVMPAATSSAAG